MMKGFNSTRIRFVRKWINKFDLFQFHIIPLLLLFCEKELWQDNWTHDMKKPDDEFEYPRSHEIDCFMRFR